MILSVYHNSKFSSIVPSRLVQELSVAKVIIRAAATIDHELDPAVVEVGAASFRPIVHDYHLLACVFNEDS